MSPAAIAVTTHSHGLAALALSWSLQRCHAQALRHITCTHSKMKLSRDSVVIIMGPDSGGCTTSTPSVLTATRPAVMDDVTVAQ